MIKRIQVLLVAALLAISLLPATTQAQHAHGTVVINGLTFPTGTSGCNGNVVGVYGSSALKNFVLQTAKDFCNNTTANPSGIDVEYLGGGDSCPGVGFAATGTASATADPLGASDVFPSPCAGIAASLAVNNPTEVQSVNMVLAFMECPGANVFQGGVPTTKLAVQTPCLGNGSGAAASKTYVAPTNLSQGQAGLVLSDSSPDWQKFGGTGTANLFTNQRITGSGTRITICYNIFGVGADSNCLDNSQNGAAATSGVMEDGVCGTISGVDGSTPHSPETEGTIGYSSRGTVYVSSQKGANGGTLGVPLANCGQIAIGGATAWNGQCDASQTGLVTDTITTAGTGAITGTDGFAICPGDEQVSTGNYAPWGYEHFFTAPGEVASDPATQYLNFLATQAEDTQLRAIGFMQTCEMNVSRAIDGGPLSIVTPTC